MTTTATPRVDATLREKILSNPLAILNDPDVMRALVAAHEDTQGENVIDMRGMAMQKLETRLDRLELTHQSVISAAYDTLSGAHQIQRAVVKLLETATLPNLLRCLEQDVAEILRIDVTRLILETQNAAPDPRLSDVGDVLLPAPPGFVMTYLNKAGRSHRGQVLLRRVRPNDDMVYGEHAQFIQSEACMKLNIGPNALPALLVFGSQDKELFNPSHGTDLLNFFTLAFERILYRLLHD